MKNCGMPLAELIRMSADPSCRLDNDFTELVCENGQIMMQGQSNMPRKSNVTNNRNYNSLKLAKFDMVDFELPVPCSEMSVDHDDDMVPWLNYGMEDSYGFFHELSGVILNDMSTENHLACREKKSMDSVMSFKNSRGGTSEVPQLLPHVQHNIPVPGSSDVTANNNGTSRHIISQDSIHNPSSLCAFTSLRLQKLDARQPTLSPAFTNFPCISRHLRPHRLPDKTSNAPENNDTRNALSGNNQAESAFVNQKEKVLSPTHAKCTEDVAKNDAVQNNTAHCETAAKAGQRNMEPVMAASSVCSANSVERAPNESVRDLKRKFHDTGDSEDLSEEVEEDSVGARKAPLTRIGSKRTRAAEVHNQSERRRRDRINEKMRALQELIPNCNKVDKASMLDEAIEYLKTLQLQAQMMSMGAGFYMQPMMLPRGIQAIQGAHMPHFLPMGMGMGMGMGFGFNMLDMNNSMKMIPFQGPPYALPSTLPAFHGMPSTCLQAFGQGLPIHMQQPPVLPPSFNIPVGLNVLGVSGTSNTASLAPSYCPKDYGQQMLQSNNVESSMNQASIQNAWKLTREGIWNPPPYHGQARAFDPRSEALPR